MRQGCDRHKAGVVDWARIAPARLIALGCCALSVAACGSDGGRDLDVTGDKASEINWTFADAEAMEQKVANLQSENDRLQNVVNALKRRLRETERVVEVFEQKRSDEAAAAALADAAAAAKPTAKPVITAPNAAEDLPDDSAPVQRAPRLVQPSFASAAPVFENEAIEDIIDLESVLFGVHLDSYREEEDARAGWRKLQRENPNELGLLEPRIESVALEDKGAFIRLIAGGFATQAKAEALCKALMARKQHCRVVGFSGDKLSLVERS